MKKLRNRVTGMLLAMLCFATLVIPAAAYARVDTAADTSLSIQYKFGEDESAVPLNGMKIHLYKVLDMSDAVVLTPTGEFAALAEFMDLVNEAKWDDLTTTLPAYIQASQTTDTPIAPAVSGTVEEGKVVFDKDQTDVGVYLITGEPLILGGYTYTPQPCFVTLPLLESVTDPDTDAVIDEIWHYDAAVAGKVARTGGDNGGGPTRTSRNVMKVWDDAGYTDNRPAEITVTLMKDGAAYDSVTLSASNNWRHSWTGLENADWAVVEDVPDGYDVIVAPGGNTFVVTNTIDIPEIVEEDVPLGELPDLDDDDEMATLDDEDVPLAMLPETGIPWLPVQMLATVGVLLFAAGYVILRRGRGEA